MARYDATVDSKPRPVKILFALQLIFLVSDAIFAYILTAMIFHKISTGIIFLEVPIDDIKMLQTWGVEALYAEFLTALYFISLVVSSLIFYGIVHRFCVPLSKTREDWIKLSWAGLVFYFAFVLISLSIFIKLPWDITQDLYPLSKVIFNIMNSITAGVLTGIVVGKAFPLYLIPLTRRSCYTLGLINEPKRKFVLMKIKY